MSYQNITPLPQPPLRVDVGETFNNKAFIFNDAINPLIVEINLAGSYADSLAATVLADKLLAEGYSNSASNDRVLAQQAVTDASIEADRSETARDVSNSYKLGAETAAAAAGSAVGLPSLIGNASKALTVNTTEDGVEWSAVDSFQVGEVLLTTNAQSRQSPQYLACNGFSYDPVTYPLLASVLGSVPNGQALNTNIPTSTNAVQASCYSSDGQYLVIGSDTISAWKRNGDDYSSLVISGLVFSESVNDLDFDPSDTYLAVGGGSVSSSRRLYIYKKNMDDISFLENISALVPAEVNSLRFDSTGTYLAVGHITSPFLTILKRTGDSFVKLSNPSVIPSGTVSSVDFSFDSNYLISSGLSSRLIVYQRSGDVFTKLTDPSQLPVGTICGAVRSLPSKNEFVINDSGGETYLYSISGTTVSLLDSISSADLFDTSRNKCRISADGSYFCNTAYSSGDRLRIFKLGDGFIGGYITLESSPPNASYAVSFEPTGEHLFTGWQSSPYIQVNKPEFLVPNIESEGLANYYIKTGE